MHMKSLVCVFAHPDDEAMGPGGTVAKYAATRDVFLLCATFGNNKQRSRENLVEVRKRELLESAKILGVKKVDFLGFDDGELNNNLYHDLAKKIEAKVRKYRPDTLMTFETTGITGHLDHIAVSLTTSFVFSKLSFVKNLLYFCVDKKTAENFARDYFVFVPPGHMRAEVHECIDISSEFEQKVKAIQAHKSQQKDVDKIIDLLEKTNKTSEYFLKLQK